LKKERWNKFDEVYWMNRYWDWRLEEWNSKSDSEKNGKEAPVKPDVYPTYPVRSVQYNAANVEVWNQKMGRWIDEEFPRRSCAYDPGPPPAKPILAESPFGAFRKFLDGYLIFSGFAFLAICFCVFAFLMWWLIGILSGSYFMPWLTVILMAAAIPITIHYGMKK